MKKIFTILLGALITINVVGQSLVAESVVDTVYGFSDQKKINEK